MGLGRTRARGQAIPDDIRHHDDRGSGILLGSLNRQVNRLHIQRISDTLHVPAIGLETFRPVLGEGKGR